MQLVGDDRPVASRTIVDNSFFLRSAFKLNVSRIIGQIPEDAKRDPSLGKLWAEVPPLDGKYVVEVATELPFYLPDLNGAAEYELETGGARYTVCNRMIRAISNEGAAGDGGPEYYLVHRLGLESIRAKQVGKPLFPLPMRTLVTRRFIFEGATAEDVIQEHFLECRNELMSAIAGILHALRITMRDRSKMMLPLSGPSTCPIFWVALKGKDAVACQQFAGQVAMAAHRSLDNLDQEMAKSLFANLAISNAGQNYELGLALAFSFHFYGYLELALVQLSTACESYLSLIVKDFLKTQNVSNSTLDDSFEDVSYSQLLNYFLPTAMGPEFLNKHRDLVGDLNWARKRRNEIVHKGTSDETLTSKRVGDVLGSAMRLFDILRATHSAKSREQLSGRTRTDDA